MTVYHVKAADITSRDASPAVRVSAGKGEAGRVKSIEAFATPTASAGVDSTIQFARVPWSAKVKEVEVLIATAQDTTGIFDFGVYHATDGSNASSVPGGLLAAAAVDQDLFSITALDAGGNAAYAKWVPGGGFRITNATPAIDDNSVWPESAANLELWEAAGLTSNPGGNADIVGTVTEAPGASTTPIYVRVQYIE
jgi:hypothetical protein